MAISRNKCDLMSKDELWRTCTELGIPKPGKKEEVSAEDLRRACCYPDVLSFPNLTTKTRSHMKVFRIDKSTYYDKDIDKNKFMVVDTKDNKTTFVNCEKSDWDIMVRKGVKYGDFYGEKCNVIECTGEECRSQEHKDIVTIRRYTRGRFFRANSRYGSEFRKKMLSRI